MVLVQWRGLPLEETSWEEWHTFKTLHHLEDKVLFDCHGSDMKTTKELQLAREVQEEMELLKLVGQHHPVLREEKQRQLNN